MSVFDEFDFDGMRRSQEAAIKPARTAAKGLGSEQLVPGALVTLSTNKATGDRSYTSDIYEIVVSSPGTVIIKPTGLCERPWSDTPRAIQIHEHEFYAAEVSARAIRSIATEA